MFPPPFLHADSKQILGCFSKVCFDLLCVKRILGNEKFATQTDQGGGAIFEGPPLFLS